MLCFALQSLQPSKTEINSMRETCCAACDKKLWFQPFHTLLLLSGTQAPSLSADLLQGGTSPTEGQTELWAAPRCSQTAGSAHLAKEPS